MEKQPPSVIPIKPPVRVVNPARPIVVATSEDLPQVIKISMKAELSIGIVRPEIPLSIEFENSTISKIEMKLKETYRNVNLTIEKLKGKPVDLPEPKGTVWAYYEIDINVPDEAVESARINFWVLKEWLQTHGVASENVTLLRYHAGEWRSLPTTIIDENLTHVQYLAETPGFSIFAVSIPVKAPSFKVKNLTISPSIIRCGENVTIKVEVENAGEDAGEYTVMLLINGTVEASKTVMLNAGESTTVTFITKKDVAGIYEVEVSGLKGSFEVIPKKLAEFEVSDLTVTPSEILVGETATISVTVKNVGELEGSYNVTLTINGVVESIKTITLAGGESTEVKFEATRKTAGTYQLEVNGLTKTLEVREAPAQLLRNFLPYIGAITIVTILVAIVVLKRKT